MRRLVALAVLALVLSGASAAGLPSRPALTFTRSIRGKHTDRQSVWVAGPDGSHAREVARNGFGSKLSSDGRWLTFDRELPQPNGYFYKLLLVDLVTGNLRSLGATTGDECWSPTRPQFAVSQPGGFYLVDAPSGRRTQLLSAKVSSCDFTPNGDSIVLARGRLDESFPPSDLFVLRLSDHSLRRLTHDRHSRSPLVSRAGIAYVRFHDPYDFPEVWWMRVGGSGPRLLARCCEDKFDETHVGYRGFQPIAMSEDGRRLLVCHDSEQSCDPLGIDLPSGRRHWLTTPKISPPAQGYVTAVDLSSDGRTALAIVGPWDDEPGIRLLYALPFRSGKPTLLARNVVEASWRP